MSNIIYICLVYIYIYIYIYTMMKCLWMNTDMDILTSKYENMVYMLMDFFRSNSGM